MINKALVEAGVLLNPAQDTTLTAGNEGLLDIISNFSETFSSFFSGGKSAGLVDSTIKKADVTLLDSSLKKTLLDKGFDGIAGHIVYRPERLNDTMMRLADTLEVAVTELQDIQERLLLPVTVWFEQAITTKDFKDKVWSIPKRDLVNIKKISERLSEHLSNKASSVGHNAKFGELYNSIKEFENVGETLAEVEEKKKRINLAELISTEERLLKAVKIYQENDFIEDIPKRTAEGLADCFRSIGDEMELLAVVVNESSKAIVAYNDTQDSLKKEL